MNDKPEHSQRSNVAHSAPTRYRRRRRRGSGHRPGGSNGQRPPAPTALTAADLVRDRQFGSLLVSRPVSSALQDLNYATPTPIQEQTIPAMLEGVDLVGQAQTGTGKTAAFGIPLAETLDPGERAVQSIVLTPTRELAIQVSDELRDLCRHRELRVVTVVRRAVHESSARRPSQGSAHRRRHTGPSTGPPKQTYVASGPGPDRRTG